MVKPRGGGWGGHVGSGLSRVGSCGDREVRKEEQGRH